MPRKKKQIRTTSDIIDEMHQVREEYRALDAESNVLKAKYAELDAELVTLFDVDGINQSRTDLATATLSESVVASIKDPKRFWAWVGRFKKWHLVENRVSNPAYREEMENRKEEIPGLSSYTNRKISLKNR